MDATQAELLKAPNGALYFEELHSDLVRMSAAAARVAAMRCDACVRTASSSSRRGAWLTAPRPVTRHAAQLKEEAYSSSYFMSANTFVDRSQAECMTRDIPFIVKMTTSLARIPMQ